MSTSYHEGLIPLGSALYGAAADPMDAVLMRDGVANGLLHAADSMGQARVNYNRPTGTYASIASGSAGLWRPFTCGQLGSWPLTAHADGTPYKLRIRVGMSASASSANTIRIRVVIAPLGRASAVLHEAVDHVYSVSVTASTVTSPTWVTGASRGIVASETLLTISAETAREWIARVPTYDAVSSASPAEVQQILVAAHVYGSSSGASSLPRLHALHLSEYCGL